MLALWGPVVAWAGVIFSASSVSHPPDLPAHVTDKMAHASVYAVLAIAIVRALAGGRWAGLTTAAGAWAVLATTLYGLTDEFHQSFVPSRTPDLRDVAADLAGATLAIVLVLGVRWLRARRAANG